MPADERYDIMHLKHSPVYILSALLLSAVLFFSGCATAVKSVPLDYPAVLIKEGELFLSFNLVEDKTLVGEYLSEKNIMGDTGDFLDRTGRLSLSINGEDKSIAGVAQGKFPRFWTGFALGFDSNWIKKKSTGNVWEDKRSSTEISIPKNGVVFFSQGASLEPYLEKASSGVPEELPPRVKNAMNSFPVVVYSPQPSSDLFKSFGMNTKALSIKDLLLSLSPVEDNSGTNGVTQPDLDRKGYLISGTINFKDEKGAKIFNTGLKLAFLTMAIKDSNSAMRELIKSNPFYLSGKTIIFKNIRLGRKDILSIAGERGK